MGIAIRITSRFEKNYQKLRKEIVFRGNPFDPQLKTHKLHGKERDAWAFSITRSYRIKFLFLEDGGVLFLDIGTHDVYE
jgi:mRNA-degrading endonuclease YafQ of YafQ-DinJ toxin-antitoxin module